MKRHSKASKNDGSEGKKASNTKMNCCSNSSQFFKKERVTDLELGRGKCSCRKLIILRDPKQASTDLNWMNNREREAADPFQGNNYRFVLWTAKKVCFFPK